MAYNKHMRRVLPFIVVLTLILSTLACNLPRSSNPAYSPDTLFQYAQQTLTVQAEQTTQPLITPPPLAEQTLVEPISTALPGSTPPPVPTPSPNPDAFPGLHTPEPGVWPPASSDPGAVYLYTIQPGDTRDALKKRFEVTSADLDNLPDGLLPPGAKLEIPNTLGATAYADALLLDSEIIASPTSVGFDAAGYVTQSGGYLSQYSEVVNGETLTGAQIVQRLALDTSTNPRLLLAIIEYRTGWVSGPQGEVDLLSPLGFNTPSMTGLYKELSLVTRFLTMGYYGWRDGSRVSITPRGGSTIRLSPDINAGTAALLNLFATLYYKHELEAKLYAGDGFLDAYARMFGDPWARAAVFEPLFPPNLTQPTWELPYAAGTSWHLTSGPHIAWGYYSPRGAIDFAPRGPDGAKCQPAAAWVTASTAGVVVRSERGQLLVDMDGDGLEQTGWVMLYMHIASVERAPVGTSLNVNDPLGHPSCEGGLATGTHVHIVRKYNGEWIAANGALPLTLSGWEVSTGAPPYQGSLTRDGVTVKPDPIGMTNTLVER